MVVFLDASTHPTAPSWPIRNVLSRLALSHSYTSLRLVAYRDSPDATVPSLSRTARITLDPANLPVAGQRPGVVGWEKNDRLKLGPRVADLAPLMDPTRLADQAVDLNLQLMRWRIMPELDLDKVKETKVLLLGAGTLGCYVARTLMAWGVRKITLVDSSTVSFSNPVRQPLFEFEDSLGGGKPKAEAAAASLKRIYPGVVSQTPGIDELPVKTDRFGFHSTTAGRHGRFAVDPDARPPRPTRQRGPDQAGRCHARKADRRPRRRLSPDGFAREPLAPDRHWRRKAQGESTIAED